MSFTNHPCDRYSCCENVGGQCFGGGCHRNPIRERDIEDAIITCNDVDEEEESED